MKIIHFYDGHERVLPGQGSVPSVVFNLAKTSIKLKHEVTVVERRWIDTPKTEDINGIFYVRFDHNISSNVPLSEPVYSEITRLGGLVRFTLDRSTLTFKALKILKELDYDIVHFHLPFSANMICTVSWKIAAKSIYTAHVGQENIRFNLSEGFNFSKVYSPDLSLIKKVRLTILMNEPLKQKLISKGIAANRISVIPNGIDVKSFTTSPLEVEKIREKFGVKDITLMFAGSVFPRKGIHKLLEAIKLIKNARVQVIIAGRTDVDPTYVNTLIKMTKTDKLNVLFTGMIPYEELRALYSLADIAVLPSIEEGDPIFLKEMMAMGKPLVGSDVGGITSQIIEGYNGFKVQPGNVDELSNRLRILIENEELRRKFGINSKKLAEQYSWENITKKYIEAYNRVIG